MMSSLTYIVKARWVSIRLVLQEVSAHGVELDLLAINLRPGSGLGQSSRDGRQKRRNGGTLHLDGVSDWTGLR